MYFSFKIFLINFFIKEALNFFEKKIENIFQILNKNQKLIIYLKFIILKILKLIF